MFSEGDDSSSFLSTLYLVPVLSEFDKRYMHGSRRIFSQLILSVAKCLRGITYLKHMAPLTHCLGNIPQYLLLFFALIHLFLKLRVDHDIAVQFSAAYF